MARNLAWIEEKFDTPLYHRLNRIALARDKNTILIQRDTLASEMFWDMDICEELPPQSILEEAFVATDSIDANYLLVRIL